MKKKLSPSFMKQNQLNSDYSTGKILLYVTGADFYLTF